jgi:hypothetical protein
MLGWLSVKLLFYDGEMYKVYRFGLMVFNTFFKNISVISPWHGVQFYWWRELEYLEKTTDLLQVTDKHNVLLSTFFFLSLLLLAIVLSVLFDECGI